MNNFGAGGIDANISKTRDAMAALGAANRSPSNGTTAAVNDARDMYNLNFKSTNTNGNLAYPTSGAVKSKPLSTAPGSSKPNKAKRAVKTSDPNLPFKDMEQRYVEQVEQLLVKVGRPCELAGLGQRVPMPSALMGKTTLKYVLRKYPDRFELVWKDGHVRAVTAVSLGSGVGGGGGNAATSKHNLSKVSVKPISTAYGAKPGTPSSSSTGARSGPGATAAVAFAANKGVGPKLSDLELEETRYITQVERLLHNRRSAGEPCGLPTVGKLCPWPFQLGKPRLKWMLQQYPSRFRFTEDGFAVEIVRSRNQISKDRRHAAAAASAAGSTTPVSGGSARPALAAPRSTPNKPTTIAAAATTAGAAAKASAKPPSRALKITTTMSPTAATSASTPGTGAKAATTPSTSSATTVVDSVVPVAAATVAAPAIVSLSSEPADIGVDINVNMLLINNIAQLERELQACTVLRGCPDNQVDQVVAIQLFGVRTTSLDLVSVATSSKVYVFDCVALTPRVVCDALRPLLESEDVVKLIHDLHLHSYILATFGNVHLAGVLDTQIAGEMMWGEMEISLNGLLRALGLPRHPLKKQMQWRLEREHALWSKRPFFQSDLKSAALDASLLLDAASTLLSRLDGYSWNRILKASGIRAAQSAQGVEGERMVCFDRSNRFALASAELMQVLEDGAAVYHLPDPEARDDMEKVARVLPKDMATVLLDKLDKAENSGNVMDGENEHVGLVEGNVTEVNDTTAADVDESITSEPEQGVVDVETDVAANSGDTDATPPPMTIDEPTPTEEEKVAPTSDTTDKTNDQVKSDKNGDDDSGGGGEDLDTQMELNLESILQEDDNNATASGASISDASGVANFNNHNSGVHTVNDEDTDIKRVTEIVLDLGRRPMYWVGRVQRKRAWLMLDETRVVTREDLDTIADHFKDEGGLEGEPRIIHETLHRCSPVHNRNGVVVGVTISIGRWVRQCADVVLDLLVGTTRDMMFLGSSVGSTAEAQVTVLREVARVLSEHEHVCIIDTSHRMSGGDVAHQDLGFARCFSVPPQTKNTANDVTADVMLRCVREHSPGVLVVDDVSTSAQVEVLRQIKRRGVRILIGVSGELKQLLESDDLKGLLGGTEPVDRADVVVFGGGNEAGPMCGPPPLRRACQPVINTIVSVPHDLVEWEVMLDAGKAVDSLLRVNECEVQERSRVPGASYVHMRQTWSGGAEMN